MAKRSNHFSLEDHERRASAQFVVIKEWLFGPDPDPTYDRLNGWKLDQFAMAFVPDLVRQYKRIMAEGHPHALPRGPLESRNPWEWLRWSSELSGEIRRLLLNARFEVKGYQLQDYCRKNVTTHSGKRAQKGGPDDNTIRAAISKFGLRKYIKPT
jgi:hypothetical protein